MNAFNANSSSGNAASALNAANIITATTTTSAMNLGGSLGALTTTSTINSGGGQQLLGVQPQHQQLPPVSLQQQHSMAPPPLPSLTSLPQPQQSSLSSLMPPTLPPPSSSQQQQVPPPLSSLPHIHPPPAFTGAYPIANTQMRGSGQLTWLSSKAGLITCSKPAPTTTVSFQLKDFCDGGVTDLTSVLRVGFRLSFNATATADSNDWIANYVSPVGDSDLLSGSIFPNGGGEELNLELIEANMPAGARPSAAQKDHPYSLEMETSSLSFLLTIFHKNCVHFIPLSSLHSRISNSGREDLYRYIGSSSLKRRQFIERRSYIFHIAENDMVLLQPPEIYTTVCLLSGFLLSHGGVTSTDALFTFFNNCSTVPPVMKESIQKNRHNFLAFLARHPFAFAPFPSQFYVAVRRNLPYFDYNTFIKKYFPACTFHTTNIGFNATTANAAGGRVPTTPSTPGAFSQQRQQPPSSASANFEAAFQHHVGGGGSNANRGDGGGGMALFPQQQQQQHLHHHHHSTMPPTTLGGGAGAGMMLGGAANTPLMMTPLGGGGSLHHNASANNIQSFFQQQQQLSTAHQPQQQQQQHDERLLLNNNGPSAAAVLNTNLLNGSHFGGYSVWGNEFIGGGADVGGNGNGGARGGNGNPYAKDHHPASLFGATGNKFSGGSGGLQQPYMASTIPNNNNNDNALIGRAGGISNATSGGFALMKRPSELSLLPTSDAGGIGRIISPATADLMLAAFTGGSAPMHSTTGAPVASGVGVGKSSISRLVASLDKGTQTITASLAIADVKDLASAWASIPVSGGSGSSGIGGFVTTIERAVGPERMCKCTCKCGASAALNDDLIAAATTTNNNDNNNGGSPPLLGRIVEEESGKSCGIGGGASDGSPTNMAELGGNEMEAMLAAPHMQFEDFLFSQDPMQRMLQLNFGNLYINGAN